MPDDAVTEQNVNGVNLSAQAVTPHSLVTDDNVRAALTADKGASARLTAWKIVDFIKKGDNYICLVTSVEVKYELDGQSSDVVYVVKIYPCRNMEFMKEFISGIFEKEVHFFLHLAPEMNAILREIGEKMLNLPRCVYTSLEKGKQIIFLEDLRALGFKMSDRRAGLDKAQTTLVLQELARFHAASILVQAKAPDEDMIARYPFLERGWEYYLKRDPIFLSFFENQIKNSKDLLVKFGGYDRAVTWIDSILPKLTDIMEEQMVTGKYKMVCHGDCWNNNLLFRYSEDGHPVEVMLLDFQLTRVASPNTDLNYFLYTSTTGKVRRPNIDAFFSMYYNSLSRVLEAGNHEVPLTQAELQQDFKEKNLHGVIMSMFGLPFVIIDSEHVIDLDSGTDEEVENMLQNMNEKSMDDWDNNPVMRPRFLSMFEDMIESGVIP